LLCKIMGPLISGLRIMVSSKIFTLRLAVQSHLSKCQGPGFQIPGCPYLYAGSAPVHMTGTQERNFAKAGARAQGHKYQPVITLMLAVRLFICLMPRRTISLKQVPGSRVTNLPVITLMLAVRLFICPVPRRAISPKQVPGPRVTNTMLSFLPPTTLNIEYCKQCEYNL